MNAVYFAGAGSGLHRRCRGVGATDPLHAAQGRHSGVPHRTGGDRGRQRDAAGKIRFTLLSPERLRSGNG